MHFIHLFYILFALCNAKKPNIVLILTDDQDLLLDGLSPMAKTIEHIANQGTIFQNAYVNAPICCPSRSSLLTGMLPHNTEVKNNSVSGNCAGPKWTTNLEPYSLAPLLAKDGYVNSYFGKYLNQYGRKEAGGVSHVPEGWQTWFGLVGNSKYYDFDISVNGTHRHYEDTYLTDLLKMNALSFLEQEQLKDSPFFMVLATPAPHMPCTPAPRHVDKFKNVKAHRTPSFNYTPHNKHWLLQMPPTNLPADVTRLDKIQQLRFESLLSVDEMVEEIIAKISGNGDLLNTYIIYTSDNGFHIGQFGQPWDKRQPYETDIKVPLIIRGPGIKKKSVFVPAVQSIDLAPTILQMAGLPTPYYMDGKSFLTDLLDPEEITDWSKNILIEYNGEGDESSNDEQCSGKNDDSLAECKEESWCKCQDSRNNTYNCVRELSPDRDFLFCIFQGSQGFVEAYDMKTDQYQLNNIFNKLKKKEIKHYGKLLNDLMSCRGELCRNL